MFIKHRHYGVCLPNNMFDIFAEFYFTILLTSGIYTYFFPMKMKQNVKFDSVDIIRIIFPQMSNILPERYFATGCLEQDW